MKIGNWQLERCTNKTTTSTLLGQILHCDGGRPIINGFSRILATLGLRNEAFDKWTLNCQENLFCFSGWLTFPYIDSYVWLFFGDHWLRVIKFVNHALLLARSSDRLIQANEVAPSRCKKMSRNPDQPHSKTMDHHQHSSYQ